MPIHTKIDRLILNKDYPILTVPRYKHRKRKDCPYIQRKIDGLILIKDVANIDCT